MTDWLDDLNEGARLFNEEQFEEASSLYESVAVQVANDPTVTAKFHHMLALRRAAVAGELERKEETLHHFSAAMRIAYEDLQDTPLVVQTCREMLETIREWQDWELLAATARQLVAFGQQHELSIVCLEAGWHMPYAYRGLGDFAHAREYAGVILERMQEIENSAAIREWEGFLRSLPSH